MSPKPTQPMLTLDDVAKRYGVSVRTVRRMMKRGLPHIRVTASERGCGPIRFSLAALKDYERSMTRTPAPSKEDAPQ